MNKVKKQQIIINADDFGKSLERNRAIDYSFKNNLIDSASLIVTGRYLNDALEYIRAGEYFDKIHLHFNIRTNLLEENSCDIPISTAMRKSSTFCNNGLFFNGIKYKFYDVRKWKIIYKELIAQYEKFITLTDGKANYKQIEFHMWTNLSLPASIALNLFTRKYNIEYVRYYPLFKKRSKLVLLCRLFSWNPNVKYIPATNIDYYISKPDLFVNIPFMELYCHPNYKNGIFLDDSPSDLGHERQPMIKHIERLQEIRNK